MITVVHAADVAVDLEPLATDYVVTGSPRSGVADLPAPPGLEVGVWEHTEGASTDVEVDEVFVVISGRATITVEGQPSVEIGPGDVVTLAEGTATRWAVHEPLRKVYVTLA